jgi:hypothetical protein
MTKAEAKLLKGKQRTTLSLNGTQLATAQSRLSTTIGRALEQRNLPDVQKVQQVPCSNSLPHANYPPHRGINPHLRNPISFTYPSAAV